MGARRAAPYAKVMPWVLIVLGLGLAVYAVALRSDRHTSSVVKVEQPVPGNGTKLSLTKQTTTESQLSDTLFGSLVGIAAALIIVGAFYPRVRTVTVAGQTIGLTAGEEEAKSFARAVVEQLTPEVRASGTQALPIDRAIELAERAAAAAALAQQRGVQYRAVVALTGAGAEDVIEAPLATRTPTGTQQKLPNELIERLAERALAETDEEPGERSDG